MKELENINPKVYTASAVIIGFLLMDDFNAYEQNAIGNFFMLIGQVLESNSAQQQAIESKLYGDNININSKINKSIYNPIFFDIKIIKEVMDKTTPNSNGHMIEVLEKIIKNINAYINEIKK